jgi:hypothetical protein
MPIVCSHLNGTCPLVPSIRPSVIALVADTEVFCKFWEEALVGIPIAGIFGCTHTELLLEALAVIIITTMPGF